MTATFMDMVRNRWAKGFFVCVGLDSDPAKIPICVKGETDAERQVNFNSEIIRATADLAVAYKANSAFYEKLGAEGFAALEETTAAAHKYAPGVAVIDDAKRADIGNTNEGYADSAFEQIKADAITLHPYLGAEALGPFLNRPHEATIVLCRTSNKGAREFQDRLVLVRYEELKELLPEDHDGRVTIAACGWHRLPNGVLMPLYQFVVLRVSRAWNTLGNCAIVAGATYPEELGMLRYLAPSLPFLIPGIGAQGGDVEKTVKAGKDSNGEGMIINASRSIIFASNGEDFAEAARNETIRLTNLINSFR